MLNLRYVDLLFFFQGTMDLKVRNQSQCQKSSFKIMLIILPISIKYVFITGDSGFPGIPGKNGLIFCFSGDSIRMCLLTDCL